jgi:hypothetical protein
MDTDTPACVTNETLVIAWTNKELFPIDVYTGSRKGHNTPTLGGGF